MKRILICLVLLTATAAFGQTSLPERFQLPATQSLFQQIRSGPGFDLSKPATFGYFFISNFPARLATVREQLERESYVFVETHVDKKGRTWLQMSKSEVHSPESMVERNSTLEALAGKVEFVRYDGWDITRNAP
jgi:regulator of ribonuclease activity B